MDEQRKEFTGVWIPKHIIDDQRLKPAARLIYAEISCFNVCTMSNKTLGERAGCSESTAKRIVGELKSFGYLKQISFDGRIRKITSLKDLPRVPGQNDQADSNKMTRQTGQNDPEDNSIENSIEKINNNYDENKVTNKISANNTTSSPGDTETIDLSIPLTVKALYYRVLKLYPGMPIINHNHINAWVRALEAIPGALEYLQNLIDIDYPNYRNDADYKPSISSPKDIVDKKIKIENWLSNVRKVENDKARDLYLRTL